MTVSGDGAAASRAAPSTQAEGGALRLRLYGLCLLVSMTLFALVHGWASGVVAILPAGAVAALLVLAGAAASALARRLLGTACILAFATIVAIPLGVEIAAGASLPQAVRATTVWPQVLVALFSSRLLAELCEQRFAAFWRSPLAAGGRPRTQSFLAALVLGGGLTLLFYQITGGIAVAPSRLDPAAIVLRALTGETAVHVAIVLLFFVVASAILDAALQTLNDGAVLDALRRFCLAQAAFGKAPTRRELKAIAATRLALFSHSRTIQCLHAAAESEIASDRAQGSRASLEAFHAASRRVIRALLSFLPLLGFLGTVIGLTAAIGSLPAELGPDAAGSTDISGSLAGLAVKFETTLLGLSGGLLASMMLAFVERRESELSAECRRLVEAAADDR